MNYQQKLENLKRYAKMETEEDIKLFEITAYELAETKDPEILKELIDIFDDECEYPEVMYSLVHAIETYPSDVYVKGVMLKIKNFLSYLEWYKTLVYGILNHGKCLQLFKENVHLADQDKLLELLDIMYQESEAHRPVIDELRKLINKERE